MCRIKSVDNEQGAILFIVLFTLVLVTAMGLAAMATTGNDLIVSGNGKNYKQNLLRANAAVIEIAAEMAAHPSPETEFLPTSMSFDPEKTPWLINGAGGATTYQPETDEWIFSGDNQNAAHSSIYDEKSGYSVIFKGLAPGASYDMSLPNRMWEYSIYGRSELNYGEIIVNSGYRQRF